MKLRTLLYIILAMGVLYVTSWLFVSNREVLEQPFHFWGDVDLPVSLTLLLFLLVGVAITMLSGLTREAGLMMEVRRRKKDSRRAEEIEEQYSRGLSAVLEGREEEALKHFRAVLERDSRHVNTLLKVGEVLRNQEKYAEAIEYHRKAHHLKEDDTRPLYALVEDYEAKGDMDRALAVLGRIIALKKHSVSAWRKLRSLHMKERAWEKALEAQEKVEKYSDANDPRDAADRQVGRGIRYEIAVGLLESGRAKEAGATLARLVKEDPHFVPAHLRLGEALVREGQEAEAVESWIQAFEATDAPILLTVLEEHYLQHEQPLAAIEALKRCIGLARRDTLARFYLGKLYFRLEMLDDALHVLNALEGRASWAPALHHLLGRIHERRKNWREAATEYRKVIKEMDLVHLAYLCRQCNATHMEWNARCGGCGEWNTIEVNFREELTLDELGLAARPVYVPKP
jgi:lipopolysaccharide biosynthesis regulator YciM